MGQKNLQQQKSNSRSELPCVALCFLFWIFKNKSYSIITYETIATMKLNCTFNPCAPVRTLFMPFNNKRFIQVLFG